MACMGGAEDVRVVGTCPDCGAELNSEGEAVTLCSASEPDCDTCCESYCEGAC